MYNRNLMDYWPDEVQKQLEFQTIAAVEDPEMSILWNELDNMLADQFINTATERGLLRWERILKITPQGNASKNERRFAILTALNERLPYTVRMLHVILTDLCGEDGYRLYLNAETYTLTCNIGLSNYKMFDAVSSMLRRVVPANMLIITGVEYNRHINMTKYRHSELAAFTHHKLRVELVK